VCAASLVPSRFVSKRRCFLSFEKQHDYPWGVNLGLRQLRRKACIMQKRN
jgi:hypothetical protein